jgi:3-hydroxyanthranilate 3,4-dioxygenase
MPINFMAWIEENRHLLKPPVCNSTVYPPGSDFMIMVVGGPNSRKDYHIEDGPEFFYQLEGDMILKVEEDGEFRDIRINEGEIFLLPPGVPHSPQRLENTVGLVIERKRLEGEQDGLRWYCEGCGGVLYEEFFPLTNIVEQLPPVMARFWSSDEARTCKGCDAYLEK